MYFRVTSEVVCDFSAVYRFFFVTTILGYEMQESCRILIPRNKFSGLQPTMTFGRYVSMLVICRTEYFDKKKILMDDL